MKKLTPLPKLLKKAQVVFNAYIRERDRELGCISCNGKVEQAGHYFSQGKHSALRFDELNVNGQCIRCNMYLSGNLINYRYGLVERFGDDKIKELEQVGIFNKSKKWSRAELEEIIDKFKIK